MNRIIITQRVIERFWLKVNKQGDNGCWVWTGCLNSCGYGALKIGQQTFGAHRVSLAISGKEIPDGLCACHICDNPPCVNPEHLWIGTHKQNMWDSVEKDRHHHLRGEQMHIAKLKTPQIHQIRQMGLDGVANAIIAQQFNVHQSTIRKVLDGRTWWHVK